MDLMLLVSLSVSSGSFLAPRLAEWPQASICLLCVQKSIVNWFLDILDICASFPDE